MKHFWHIFLLVSIMFFSGADVTAASNKKQYLKDYKKPDFAINSVNLTVDLGEQETAITNHIELSRVNPRSKAPLILDGINQELVKVSLNDRDLTQEEYVVTTDNLTISNVPQNFSLTIVSKIKPQNNTELSGFYKSGDLFLTQCEAQGFRRITYYLDRPDVMSIFTTKIIADKKYPTLLSNGDKIASGDLPNNKHYATWFDKSKKPCYLFALVIGDLKVRKDNFITKSGRNIALEVYTPENDVDKTAVAMNALKAAMKWDEDVFGREYDLNTYMIVGAPKFNSGAMENKGLNIFNDALLLANKDIATDNEHEVIYSVIAHEYFHNWTGNRITLRDWFQLSLKEGLTVFRDQEFTSDMFSRPIKRIQDARLIKSVQFSEDAGKLAHPVRPDSYMSIENFYTSTVYEKGAELIRMLQTIVGQAGFRKGMDLYFEKFDGHAVTTEDFVSAISEANNINLEQFKLWYSQAGTPVLKVSDQYNPKNKTYTLHIKQSCPPTPGQTNKKPFLIPIKLGLISSRDGENMSYSYKNVTAKEHVIHLNKLSATFKFYNIQEKPIPSLLRDFSAPVKVEYPYTNEQLLFLFAHDENEYNKWEAAQQYMRKLIVQLSTSLQNGSQLEIDPNFYKALSITLHNKELRPKFIASIISLPSEQTIYQEVPTIDPGAIHKAKKHLAKLISKELHDDFIEIYKTLHDNLSSHPYVHSKAEADKRSLKNVCLSYLDDEKLASSQLNKADNLTDRMAALKVIFDSDNDALYKATADKFYNKWKKESLVIQKWFALQAISERADTLSKVQALTKHEAFDITTPNCIYTLVYPFTSNGDKFHALDGSGYKFIKDFVIKLDKINSIVAARLVKVFANWKSFEPVRRSLMESTLQEIKHAPGLSKNTSEMVNAMLA